MKEKERISDVQESEMKKKKKRRGGLRRENKKGNEKGEK